MNVLFMILKLFRIQQKCTTTKYDIDTMINAGNAAIWQKQPIFSVFFFCRWINRQHIAVVLIYSAEDNAKKKGNRISIKKVIKVNAIAP